MTETFGMVGVPVEVAAMEVTAVEVVAVGEMICIAEAASRDLRGGLVSTSSTAGHFSLLEI